MVRLLLLLLFSGLVTLETFARVIVPDSKEGVTKDTSLVLRDVAEAARIDSAIMCYYEDLLPLLNDVYSVGELAMPDSLPVFDGAIYQNRLAALDLQTPFDLSYNAIVEAFIHLYVSKKRELSSNCLGRSSQYFPLFEETFDRYNLPLELKYLAVVESALDPRAKSRVGATGLWQFMYGTGKNFGLDINSYVDERSDPAKSTEAAAKYLSYLYKMFGDWNLALAAYNCGEGRVARAIRRSGGKKGYWEIYPYLPKETRGYVPAFIAVNYLFAHAEDHKIIAAPVVYYPFELDSVHVKHQVSFSMLSDLLDVPMEDIERMNPSYRLGVVPGYGSYTGFYLPKDKVNLWVANEEKLTQIVQAKQEEKAVEPIVPQDVTYYTVRSGDYLGKIAARHGCTVSQIQAWNGLSGTALKPGQRLTLYTKGSAPAAPSPQPSPAKVEPSGDNIYYSVRPGDTLWDIAKARGLSVDDLKRWNAGVNFNNMRPGLKIIIGKA